MERKYFHDELRKPASSEFLSAWACFKVAAFSYHREDREYWDLLDKAFSRLFPKKFSLAWREEVGITQNYQFSVMLVKMLWKNTKRAAGVRWSAYDNRDSQKWGCSSTHRNGWTLGGALPSGVLPSALLCNGALPSPSPEVPTVLPHHLSGCVPAFGSHSYEIFVKRIKRNFFSPLISILVARHFERAHTWCEKTCWVMWQSWKKQASARSFSMILWKRVCQDLVRHPLPYIL